MIELGQVSATRGSWTLFQKKPEYSCRIEGDLLWVGLIHIRLKDIWALPSGLFHIEDSLAYIQRKAPEVSPEG